MKSKGFTLLELLLVLSLLLIVFGVIGFSFSSNIKQNLELSERINKTIESLSIYNQLSKQLFSGYQKNKENFRLDRNRISFYTLYPVFFSGAARAEYYVEEKEGKNYLMYEEFPFIDGKLGYPGLKKQVLGIYKQINFEVLNNNKYYETFSGKDFPQAVKIVLDGQEYIFFNRR